MSEKLQKVLARVGLGSRRHMEEVIAAGRVSVNGKIATLGDRIDGTDELRIDGRKVTFQIESEIRRRVILYYKPEGEICSRHDPDNRPTVFDHLPAITNDRWVMVGRLDINSTGLLLFTNDGELANRLMHPSNGIEREYAVRVMGEVTPQIQQTLTQGVELDDGPAKFESMRELGGEGINRWYQVIVKEGRNREVRRLFESQGLKVSRLLRTRYGTVMLPRELRTGRWIELDRQSIDSLTQSVELRPRQGTGLFGLAKRRTEKMLDHPMAPRHEPRRSSARPSAQSQGSRAPNDTKQPRPPRRNAFRTAGQQQGGVGGYASDSRSRRPHGAGRDPMHDGSTASGQPRQQRPARQSTHSRGYAPDAPRQQRPAGHTQRPSDDRGQRSSGTRDSRQTDHSQQDIGLTRPRSRRRNDESS